jgi:hypothetical protein
VSVTWTTRSLRNQSRTSIEDGRTELGSPF